MCRDQTRRPKGSRSNVTTRQDVSNSRLSHQDSDSTVTMILLTLSVANDTILARVIAEYIR